MATARRLVMSVVVEGVAVEIARRDLPDDVVVVRRALSELHEAVAGWIRGESTADSDLVAGRDSLTTSHHPPRGNPMRITRFATASALHALGAELVDVVQDDGRVVYMFAGPAASRALEQLTAAKVALRARAAVMPGTGSGGVDDEDLYGPGRGAADRLSSNGHRHVE